MACRSNKIEPIGLVPVGLAISINGQRFDCVGREDHRGQTGSLTTLMVWRSECATCGEGFTCKSPPGRFAEVRRCEVHRQPGRRVRGKA